MHVKSRFDELFSGNTRAELEARLASYIEPRRWFRSKARTLASASLAHVVPLPIDGAEVALTIVRLRYTQGDDDEYVLPLTWVHGDGGEHLAQTKPHLVVASVDVAGEARPRWLVDALGERRALDGLLALVARGAAVAAEGCTLTFRGLDASRGPIDPSAAEPNPVATEQSNTSIVFGHTCILKVVRKLDNGASPDLEMSEFLTREGYTHTPRLLAAIEIARPRSEPATVGMIHAFVANDGDAWSHVLTSIAGAAADGELTVVEGSLAFVRPLATRVAEMHAALASPTSDSRFAPEPIERPEREALGRAVERSLEAAWALVEDHTARLSPVDVDRIHAIRKRAASYRDCVARFVAGGFRCEKTRVHGDLHLGQVLATGDDFVLIDFEGEPARPLAERKAKRSPAVDVAGMLRSLHYASVAAARTEMSAETPMQAFADHWHRVARRDFLRAYYDAAQVRTVLPDDPADREVLLQFCLLEKCVYELHYELNNRPHWVAIPLLGLESVLEGSHGA
ncbi:MAG TPA: putative maltokinase [Polyangiaceae bacterium]|nr:putative maltokinase [Polyangiaceae bacterium]